MQNYRKGERISRIYFVYLHILTSGLRDTGSSVQRKRGGKTAETATSHRRKDSSTGRQSRNGQSGKHKPRHYGKRKKGRETPY